MGIMGEMMNEAVGAVMDNDDLEEETDDEIAKVLDEVLAGNYRKRISILSFLFCFIGKVGQLPSVAIGDKSPIAAAAVEDDDDADGLEERLQALRS